ncbi:MAG TPA: heme ABC exporter ATP-binding protein CcmA [Terriglobales bacterium]|nr:heme ABC exporter ATP-binding protein CcmA [Terriglobales bacterium]
MAETAVVLTNVSKLFGRFAALREVSAEFAPGRLYAVFGENGAGKSTLLRVMAGLTHPTSGTVALLGSTELREVTAQLGYMAHAPLLYDELSGMENLLYFAGLYGAAAPTRCAQAMEEVGLDPALARPAGQYSQGMRQRLSLARALLHDPKLLLLDEPFSNVDVTSARAMAKLLGARRDRGLTIFLVTHQVAHAEGIADESLWLAAGRLAARAPGTAAARLGAQP